MNARARGLKRRYVLNGSKLWITNGGVTREGEGGWYVATSNKTTTKKVPIDALETSIS